MLVLQDHDPVGSDRRLVLHSWPPKAVDGEPGWLHEQSRDYRGEESGSAVRR